jgi:hypothetical protein
MPNDIYKSKVLPDGTVRPVANAARVINPLEPLNDTAKIMNHLSMQYKKIELENEQVKQDQFESDLKLRQTQFNNELENITNQQEFDSAIEKYNSDIDTLGNNVLGEEGYKKWSNEKGRNYKALANLGYKSIWAKNLQKQNYTNMGVTVSNYATLAALDPARKNDFVAQAEMDIDSKALTSEQKQSLKNKFKVELANAEVVRDIKNNPGDALDKLKAITKDKDGNIENDKPTYYDGLTPVQRQHYIEQAKAKYEAQLNTYNDRAISDLKREFAEKYEEEGYNAAYQFYKEKTDNLATTAKEYNISQEKLKSFESWAKGILKETNREQAFANQDKFGDLQEKVQGMGITFDRKKGEYKINKKDKATVEDVVETINNINTGLKDGTYFMNEKKVKAMRETLRTVLGDIVDNGAKLRDTDVEGQTTIGGILRGNGIGGDITASEYIKDSILKVLNNKTNINNFNLDKLTTREKGEIFEHVYESAVANNIDLASYYIDAKQKIDRLTQHVFNWMVQNRFDVPEKEYGAVIGNGNMYDTNNPKAKNNIGKKSVGYGSYVIDTKGTMKLVDKNGNIIDEVRR